jgi:hypothetical protein
VIRVAAGSAKFRVMSSYSFSALRWPSPVKSGAMLGIVALKWQRLC